MDDFCPRCGSFLYENGGCLECGFDANKIEEDEDEEGF